MARTKNRNSYGQRGASLLELTCAVFVVTMGAFGALHMQIINLDKTLVIGEYAAADLAIENEIETLRVLPFAALEEGESQSFLSNTPAAAKLPKSEGRVSISDRSGNTLGLRQVTVRFSWTGEHGRKIQRQSTTIIANKD